MRAVQTRAMATKRQATPLGTFYKLVMKRTSTYMFFILFGAITMEAVGGSILDGIWRINNSGVRQNEYYIVKILIYSIV